MSRGTSGTARRYAEALLELALEQNQAAAVRDDLHDVRDVLEAHGDLAQPLTHPALPAERRRGLATAVFSGRTRTPLVARLMSLLAERGRVAELEAIEDAYVRAWNETRGVASVDATSAVDLDDAQRTALKRALEGFTGQPVELRLQTDPRLLGGLRLTLGGRVYDGTVRARLRALRHRLSGSA